MIQIDLATLVKRLNPFAKQALEMAASECMSQQASEITVAHVLLQMLAIPRNDVRVIAERTGISAEDLRQALTVESYPGGRSAEGTGTALLSGFFAESGLYKGTAFRPHLGL